ncbi:MAG: sensor histidine kinase [Chloroflexi bacterium]|nr:sensor histidine kinase [Chloroflexota bacterium]
MSGSLSTTQSRTAEALRALAGDFPREHEQQGRELAEIALLIKQTTAEIDRLTPQRQEAARRLREMETALDHYSRADIRRIYTEAQEAQMRLFMMQGRLEQLEYKQRTLERSQQHLTRVLQLLPDLSAETTDASASGGQPSSEVGAIEATAVQALQSIEEQRHQLARLLHEGTAQMLANLVLRAQVCERLLGGDEARCRSELTTLRDTVAANLHDTRRIIFDLWPLILDDLGLVPTLRRYLQLVSDRLEHPIDLAVTGFDAMGRRLDPTVEINVFRIVQEALSNALHHAQATRHRVTIDVGNRLLRATVEDNGVGFDVADVLLAAREGRARGVASMRDRATWLGSPLLLDSTPGGGTRVSIQVPLSERG